ncbi:hypothetical protein WA026_011475 [Henosepilachna vigintioctopunctata]|uniref:Uncharacterized protein n=1 Tax=Henosepilachna vigintioctopunctata TaxID=420089 RepID=A0AAW1TS68_9CUCU
MPLLTYGICQAAFGAIVVACFSAAGVLFETVPATLIAATPACNTVYASCYAACIDILKKILLNFLNLFTVEHFYRFKNAIVNLRYMPGSLCCYSCSLLQCSWSNFWDSACNINCCNTSPCSLQHCIRFVLCSM